jgi:hypothetical protein
MRPATVSCKGWNCREKESRCRPHICSPPAFCFHSSLPQANLAAFLLRSANSYRGGKGREIESDQRKAWLVGTCRCLPTTPSRFSSARVIVRTSSKPSCYIIWPRLWLRPGRDELPEQANYLIPFNYASVPRLKGNAPLPSSRCLVRLIPPPRLGITNLHAVDLDAIGIGVYRSCVVSTDDGPKYYWRFVVYGWMFLRCMPNCKFDTSFTDMAA